MAGKQDQRIFPARIDVIPEVMDYVSHAAEKAALHPKRVMHIQLAIDEAMANICNYAYQTPPGEVLVRIQDKEGHFMVEMIDEGIPFDPLNMEEPDTQVGLEEREVGGLGIFLLRQVMQEVRYRREGKQNILTFVV